MSRYGVHMDQLITPAIRCDGNADEAARFYADVFREARVVEQAAAAAGHLDALGGALRRSVTAYNKAVGSMENRLLVTARSLETLGEQVDSPTLISADAAQVRTFTAPELTTEEHPARTTT